MGSENFNNETQESKFKDEYNAKKNYEYLKERVNHLHPKVNMVVHNGVWERLTKLTGELEQVWKVLDPIYVALSWKDRSDNNYALPISFHISPYEFETQLNKFLV